MVEITRENADNIAVDNLLDVVNQVLSEVMKNLSSFDVDESYLRNQMRPNNSKIRGVWDESRNESRKLRYIIESILNDEKIESRMLKSYIARNYVRQPRSRLLDKDIDSCIEDYKNFLGEKFSSLTESQKGIIGKLIGIEDQNIISICDVFNVCNKYLDEEKNKYEEITDEQVYAKYGWLEKILGRDDLDKDSKNLILSAYKYVINRINAFKNDIRSELNKLSSVGYSVLNAISLMSDNDNFVVVCEDSNSFPKLKCTLKSNKGKWNFVLVFGYGRWGVELSDICFNGSIKVSDEIQVLSDFKEFIEKKVEKRKDGC